ncbi:MAG: helix-turn-helix domain-containing protein [Ruminococcaceae bacterium]|nr:helix-turn-helix domain-containing protein [Oscillospiraceae bacterium]
MFKYENKTVDFVQRDSRSSKAPLQCTAHLHYHIEVGCIIGGRTTIHVNTETYEAEAGDIFVCFPNQIHQFETLEKENYHLFIFNPNILPEFSAIFTAMIPKSNLIKGALNDKELLSLTYSISDSYNSDKNYRDIIVRGYLLSFFGRLFGMMDLSDTRTHDTDILGTILNYCVNNYDTPLSLSVLEKELHISRYYISHVMSTKLGIGFNYYINSLRVSNACKYLLSTDLSITEISEKVGFNTLRTFNRAFSKHIGVSPSEYRSNKRAPISSLPI